MSRIMGKRDLVPAAEVTATDLLRLLVREEATRHYVRVATWDALNQIVRKPNETTAAEAIRLTHTFRTIVLNCNRPHATEALFFWWYTTEDNISHHVAPLRNAGARTEPMRRKNGHHNLPRPHDGRGIKALFCFSQRPYGP